MADTFTAAHRTLRNTTVRATHPDTGRRMAFEVNRAGLISGLTEQWADYFRQFRDWQVEAESAEAVAKRVADGGEAAPSGRIPDAAFKAAEEALGRGADSYKRTELDGVALSVGVDNPEDLPNKGAVIAAIKAAIDAKG